MKFFWLKIVGLSVSNKFRKYSFSSSTLATLLLLSSLLTLFATSSTFWTHMVRFEFLA